MPAVIRKPPPLASEMDEEHHVKLKECNYGTVYSHSWNVDTLEEGMLTINFSHVTVCTLFNSFEVS